jgi:AcrR family transcriptional regulator
MPQETFFNLPEEKRKRVLDALLDEFSSREYAQVSVDRIVERAGISKGSFYQYFEDKRDCYLYLLQLVINEKIDFMQQYSLSAEGEDFFGSFRKMIEAGLDFQFSSPRLGRIGYLAAFSDIPLPDEIQNLLAQNSREYFSQLIQEGIENGALKDNINTEAAAFVMDAVFSNLREYLMDRFSISGDELAEHGSGSFKPSAVRRAIEDTLQILESGLRKPGEMENK